jgi:DNA-binding CsgD family transcriptional regulator
MRVYPNEDETIVTGSGTCATLLDRVGRPLDTRIAATLVSLIPRFQRLFPVFCDDTALVEVLEYAGSKIARREVRLGPTARIRAYAWVSLQHAAASRLRRGTSRLRQRTLTSTEGEGALHEAPSTYGSPQQVEQAILVRELLGRLTPANRRVCQMWMQGCSSRDIARQRGSTAASINTQMSRIRRQLRMAAGVQRCGAREAQERRRRLGAPAGPDSRVKSDSSVTRRLISSGD